MVTTLDTLRLGSLLSSLHASLEARHFEILEILVGQRISLPAYMDEDNLDLVAGWLTDWLTDWWTKQETDASEIQPSEWLIS